MSNVSNCYAGIKAVIKLLNPSYDDNSIFQSYNNNIKYPDDAFIVMTELDTRLNGLNPAANYNPYTETQSFVGTDYTWFQVDFYGTGSRNQAASFRLFLTTLDCSAFLDETYSCTVYEVQEEKNLTGILDREKYKQRHLVRFSLFNNNIVSITSPSFSSAQVGLILADVQGV